MLNKVRAICTFIFAFLAFISLDLHVNADTYYYDFEEQTDPSDLPKACLIPV